jgi:5'-3' exonuclease
MFIVIDGNAIANRCWYTFPLTKLHGQLMDEQELVDDNIGLFARFFANQLISIERAIATPENDFLLFLICWDVRTSKDKRKKLFPEYNANRVKAAPGETAIYPLITDLRKTLGLIHPRFDITHTDCEADDLIAIIKSITNDLNENLTIVSRDSDFYQLLDNTTNMYNPYEDKFVTHEHTDQFLSATPSEYPYIKAIVGDTADNWKGVSGVGKKRVRAFMIGNISFANKIQIHKGYKVIKLPFYDLPTQEITENILATIEDTTEPDWQDFIDIYELAPTIVNDLSNIP